MATYDNGEDVIPKRINATLWMSYNTRLIVKSIAERKGITEKAVTLLQVMEEIESTVHEDSKESEAIYEDELGEEIDF